MRRVTASVFVCCEMTAETSANILALDNHSDDGKGGSTLHWYGTSVQVLVDKTQALIVGLLMMQHLMNDIK